MGNADLGHGSDALFSAAVTVPPLATGFEPLGTLLIRIGNHDELLASVVDARCIDIEHSIRARLREAGIEARAISVNGGLLAISLDDVQCGRSREAVHALGHRLRAAIAREPIDINGDRAYLQVFMRASPAAGPGTDAGVPEAHPGLASSYARRQLIGPAPRAFCTDMRVSSTLLDGLRCGALVLAFQPIVLFGHPTGAWLYSEALLRRSGQSAWETCGPAIEAMERLGYISRLDQSVVWTVVGLLEQHPELRLGCNVSAASLHADLWWDYLLHYLKKAPAMARRLTLEITETAEIANSISAKALLDSLRLAGARIALDDMGSGHSSLSFLADIRPDVVKIDRSVAQRCREEGNGPDCMKDLVAECGRYSPCVIVEGVERLGDLNLVRRTSAHGVQGFLVGAPSLRPGWLLDKPAFVADVYARTYPGLPAPLSSGATELDATSGEIRGPPIGDMH